MGKLNIYVVFGPKKNFQELQLHQTLIFFSEFWQDHNILVKSVSAIFQIFLVLILFVF